jgi:adenylate kinase
MESGKLVSDDLMIGLISERLSLKDTLHGFILDGFPRTTKQAKDLKELLKKMSIPLDSAILMDIDFEILMKRLVGRRTCSKTGKLLNIYFSSKEELDACKNVGGELLKRKDDNEETIRNRLEVYRDQTEPLADFYKSENKLKVVNAEGSMDEVYQSLLTVI